MKQSHYNIKFAESNGVVLYNVATDGILQLDLHAANIFDAHADNVDALQQIYPDLFCALEKYGFIAEAVDACNQDGKQFHLSFTTNGTMLTSERIAAIERHLQRIKGYWVVPSFQITIDGNEEYHNRVRKNAAGNGSYDVIMANIKVALAHGFDIFVRFNTTNENIDSYLDVIDDFADVPKENAVHLQFDLQSVWQDNATWQTREKLDRLAHELTAEGYRVQMHKSCNSQFCYADKENTAVVNYDGNVYKCTAREFRPELAEGTLSADGHIMYNKRYTRRMELRFGNSTCHECSIYPICHGGCTQDKMENDGQDICLRHYTEEDRMKIVRDRLCYLICNRKK